MNFVFSFPLTQKNHDLVWVIVDRLMKYAHFLLVRLDYSMDRLAELYVNEIVRLHEIHCQWCLTAIHGLRQGFRRNYSQPWVLD